MGRPVKSTKVIDDYVDIFVVFDSCYIIWQILLPSDDVILSRSLCFVNF